MLAEEVQDLQMWTQFTATVTLQCRSQQSSRLCYRRKVKHTCGLKELCSTWRLYSQSKTGCTSGTGPQVFNWSLCSTVFLTSRGRKRGSDRLIQTCDMVGRACWCTSRRNVVEVLRFHQHDRNNRPPWRGAPCTQWWFCVQTESFHAS